MKYIKSYEEINSINFKRYVIYSPKFEPNSPLYKYKYLYIFEIINIEDKLITVKQHYEYNSLENTLTTKNSSGATGDFVIFKNHVIFTSDSIQECTDILPLINTSDKYNL